MDKHLFAETGSLTRFVLRRDRLRIPIWILAFAASTLLIAVAFTDLYQNAQERQAIAETMKNPAMTAMVGPGYGLANYTAGAMMAHQMLLMTAVVVGLMNILLVTRHTRTDEEDGRIEMVRSLPVGRLSNLISALLVMVFVNIVLALVIGAGLYALEIESMDLEGSLLYGAALGAAGLLFAGITAVFVQLSQNARSVIGLSIGFLLLAYIVRAIGDIGSEAIAWLSPLGWILRAEVYVNNYWWPVLLTVGVALLLGAFALYLNSIRDLGAGFLPSRPGKTRASALLTSPFGLAFRLQRTGMLAWAAGLFLIGASYGSVLGDLESFFADVDIMQEMLVQTEGFSLTEQFIPMLMSVMAIIAAIPAIMVVLKLKGEERSERVEHVLGRAVSRNRLLGSYCLLSFIVGFVMLSLAGLGLGGVGLSVMEEELALSMFFSAALAYLPAILIMAGIAVLLVGWAPKLTGFIWLYLAFSFIVVYLGGLFQFPEWVVELSPFGHVPRIPIESANYMNLAVLTGAAAVLAALGFVGYNKRDIGR
ncbi:ABC-2 type transport system permease protein [Planomicrobium soli]|uniref:ABC-2 type transport system permease protein n=1 Tax=Planomicrobium soli TaxID=1176648 RepID=A0A2P8H232_9BACL|nr:ABC transporter permease [Planomicrobium soli]PSL40273.1 ABC-2 type transport system permease protein [Planomicrobium soli]